MMYTVCNRHPLVEMCMLFVGTSIIHHSTEGIFILCNIWDLLIYRSKDKLFDSFCVEVFFNAFSDEKIHMIDNETLDTMLWKKVPRIKLELNFAQIKAIADLFAHIVDYKSPFTSNHSMGVAEGAEKISRFMGFDKDICQKMYIAGALHDIGKVAIGNEILEKPEKLTDEEFKTMKHHAVL